MSIYLDAAEAVERELARVESLSLVAATLRKVGTLDQAVAENEARLKALGEEIANGFETLAGKKAEAEKIVNDAHAQAASIKANAEQAARISQDAADGLHLAAENHKAEALGMLGEAQKQAAAWVEEGKAKAASLIEAAKTEAESYAGKIADGLADHTRVQALVAEAQAKLDAITAHIAALRAKF